MELSAGKIAWKVQEFCFLRGVCVCEGGGGRIGGGGEKGRVVIT